MKSLFVLMFVLAFALVSAVTARAQECATVTMQETAASNTNVIAQINLAGCGQTGATFLDASVTVQSNNPAARVQPTNPAPIATNGIGSVTISGLQVNSCTPAFPAASNITFTVRFKLSPAGPEQTLSVAKPLMVCPFQFDIQATALQMRFQRPAGQDSQVDVTIANQGAQTLFSNSYRVDLSTVENTSGLVRDRCVSTPVLVGTVPLPDIRPGEQRSVTLAFRFPQGGNFTLSARASIGGAEDGPANNNSRTQAVIVPLPPPLVCEVQPVSGQVDNFRIRGNWFRRFGTTEVPTVAFGNNVAAAAVQVVSPLEMTARFPGFSCLEGPMNVRVTNATGPTTALAPAVPGPLSITGTSRTELSGTAFDQVIRLANFRPNCNVTVELAPRSLLGQPLAPGGIQHPSFTVGTDQVTVRLFHPPLTSRTFTQHTLNVKTPYGEVSQPINIGPEPLPAPKLLNP